VKQAARDVALPPSVGERVEPSTRPHVSTRSPDCSPDPKIAALTRELERARTERRWVDADAIASAVEALGAEAERGAKVVDLASKRRKAARS
jgi:hypothetical protein